MRRRIARISLRPPKGQLPAKVLATQAKEVQEAAAAAAVAAVEPMRAAMTGKLPSTKIVLRRWMSRTRCFV
jgi:hypothetical protein